MTQTKALRLALEALETLMIERGSIYDKAITAIKAALSGEAQIRSVVKDEPVAWNLKDVTDAYKLGAKSLQRKPLTDEEMDAVINGCPKYHGRFSTKDPDGKLNYYELVRAVEAAHGIKELNT